MVLAFEDSAAISICYADGGSANEHKRLNEELQ